MSEIEKLPSMAKRQSAPPKRAAEQPKRPAEPPKPPVVEPLAALPPELPADEVPAEPMPAEAVAAEPAPVEPAPVEPNAPPQTLRELLPLMDTAYAAFRAAALRFPGERMDEHLGDGGWTRKQMLAHVATWHDLTHERLGKLITTGKAAKLEREVDSINAQSARVAIGKTAGEIVKDIEATYNRLHRQVQRLTDDQLRRHQGWAVMVIAANTYEHYADHIDELYLPEPAEGTSRR